MATNNIRFFASSRRLSQLDARARESDADPHRLARLFIRQRGCDSSAGLTIRHWRDEWWVWTGQKYRAVPDVDLTAAAIGVVKEDFDRIARVQRERARGISKSLLSNTKQALAAMVIVPSDREQPCWLDDDVPSRTYLALSNGLLDFDRLLCGSNASIEPHSPLWFSSVCLPYDWDSKATCRRWQAFLEQVLESDQERIALLQEWFGYCLTTDTSYHKFLMLSGEGSNGKSVTLEVLTHLVGKENVSHVPLEVFGQRFQLTSALGKLVNIAPEVSDVDRLAEGALKQFVGGDRMYFDRKNMSGVEVYPTARLVVAVNTMPRFADRSGGIWRRPLVLPFCVVIREEDQDRRLAEKLKRELPGIFNWAIEGLRRLRRNERFTLPAISQEALEELRLESNPARMFLTESCRQGDRHHIAASFLYRIYQRWCSEFEYRSLDESQFGKEVRRVYPTVVRRKLGGRKDRRYWAYSGLSLRNQGVPHVSQESSSDIQLNRCVARPVRIAGSRRTRRQDRSGLARKPLKRPANARQ